MYLQGIFVAAADLNAGPLQAVVDNINKTYPNRAKAFAFDITDRDKIKELVDQVIKIWGRLDIIINNAGVGIPNGPRDDDDEFLRKWNRTMDVNLNSHIHL